MSKRVLYEDVATTVARPVELAEGQKGFRFEALLSVAGQRNRNKRVYPLDEMQRAVEAAKPQLRRWPGTSDHPDLENGRPKLSVRSNAVLWEDLWWSGNELWGRGRIIETAAGLDLKANIEAGVEVGFSTRGRGILEQFDHPEGKSFRMKDYELITIDAVVDPSILQARVASWSREAAEEENLTVEPNLVELADKLLAAGKSEALALGRAEAAEAKAAGLAAQIAQLESQLKTANESVAQLQGVNQTLATESASLKEQLAPVTAKVLADRLADLTKADVFGAGIVAKINDAVKAGIVTLTAENAEAVVNAFRSTVQEAMSAGNGAAAQPAGNPNAAEPKNESNLSEQQKQLLAESGL